MRNPLKKYLIISVSTLMLFSFGSCISDVNAKGRISNAQQIIRLKNKRVSLQKRVNKDNQLINNINQQIDKLIHHRTPSTIRWRTGMPKIFSKKAFWAGSRRYQKDGEYMRYQMPLSAKAGASFSTVEYNRQHHVINGGAGSAYAFVNPHYESLGHGWYRLASGSMNKNSLKQELNNTLVDRNAGTVELVHMHGKNHFSMWLYQNGDNEPYYKAKKLYMGYFTRYSSYRTIGKALGDPDIDIGE